MSEESAAALGKSRLSKSLTFSLSDHEVDPSGSKAYVTLDVDAESGTFRGASACVLAEQDLNRFLEQSQLLAMNQRRDAALVGGWGTTEDIRIDLFPASTRGHIAVRVQLAEVPTSERPNRLEAYFETEPAPLLRFIGEIRSALAARSVATIALYVAGGPGV